MKRLIACGLAASFAVTAACGEELAATLPTEICRGYLFLPLTLEEKEDAPADRTLHFLYDTGASYSIVDPASILRVSGKTIEPGKNAVFSDATMGPLNVNKLRARVQDLSHLSMALGRPIDGILAYDAFGEYLVQIHYPEGEIRLYEGDLPRADGKTIFSAKGKDKRPWVKLDIDGRKRRVLIDSGSASTLVLNDLDRYEVKEPPVEIRSAVRLKRLEKRRGARLTGDVTLGEHLFTTPVVTETPDTELFGSGMLKDFVLTFDVDDKRVRFISESEGPVTVPPERSTGLSLRPVDDGMRIEKVLPDSPAASLDLKPGDILTHIDGMPIAERGCREMSDFEEVTYRRRRGEDIAEITVPIFVIVD
ncbi:PDZ domain-containing protein [Parvularcula marina]|uniref:PDZ domain-containing protein n=1 Tax=Parvularcula marina TaxID=2292771 RepID=UPI003511F1D2